MLKHSSSLSSRPERAARSGETPVFSRWLHDTQQETARRAPHLRVRSALRCAVATTLFLTPALPLAAQGCTQCLDSTRATPPPVQAAYRHAIELLGGAAATLFVTGALLLSRTTRQ